MDDDDLSPVPLLTLATGFWGSQTLAAAVELNVFTTLAGGRELNTTQAARELGLAERPADVLLTACAALGLLDKTADRYSNSPLAERYLTAGTSEDFSGFVRYCAHRSYPAWGRAAAALRHDRPATWDPDHQDSLHGSADAQMMMVYWGATHSLSRLTAKAVSSVYDFSRHKRLLDIGGGTGAYPIELCRAHPTLAATVLDLAHVCEIARQHIDRAGLNGTVSTTDHDFNSSQSLPDGYDVMLLSRVLHNWDEAHNRRLLEKCHRSSPPGGVLLIIDHLIDDHRDGPAHAALASMNMLIETTGGRNYSEAQYRQWLTDAGFASIRAVRIQAPGGNTALIAAA
ncbi:methyltransferase [Streptomyces sp. NPDC050844]|uniref:methyltransferase n=1 Tax=Streptomyces sp. NPDC050844 TaxID=3155790 RepID=UPI00340680E5